ncbi:MAG TPA: plastocyanin/azurin family copper-binding protein [Trueperaceae bacterium]
MVGQLTRLVVSACRWGAPALLVLLAACVPAADGLRTSAGPGPCPDTIVIRDFAYYPPRCTAPVGAVVTFVNRDTVTHWASTTNEAVAAFDTGRLEPGQSARVTLGSAGDYPYVCRLHPGMQAIITVAAPGSGTGGASALD